MKTLALYYPPVSVPQKRAGKSGEELLAIEAAAKMAELRQNLYDTLDAVNEGDLDILAEIAAEF